MLLSFTNKLDEICNSIKQEYLEKNPKVKEKLIKKIYAYMVEVPFFELSGFVTKH